jgi:hypothetical protein
MTTTRSVIGKPIDDSRTSLPSLTGPPSVQMWPPVVDGLSHKGGQPWTSWTQTREGSCAGFQVVSCTNCIALDPRGFHNLPLAHPSPGHSSACTHHPLSFSPTPQPVSSPLPFPRSLSAARSSSFSLIDSPTRGYQPRPHSCARGDMPEDATLTSECSALG